MLAKIRQRWPFSVAAYTRKLNKRFAANWDGHFKEALALLYLETTPKIELAKNKY